MKKILFNKIFFIIASLLFLTLGLFGVGRLHLRSGMPFQWQKQNNQVVVTSVQTGPRIKGLAKGDILLRIENYPIKSGGEIEYILDTRVLGQIVSVFIQRGEEIFSISIPIVSQFSITFIIINLLLGLLFWIVGIFVFLSKSNDRAARVFFWACMTLSVSIMGNWPCNPVNAGFLGYIHQVLYYVIYPLVPAFLLYLTTIYPNVKVILRKYNCFPYLIFSPSLLFILLLDVSYLSAIYLKSIEHYYSFGYIYNAFRVYLIIYFIASIAFFIHSYKFSDTTESRDKIRWILWGMCVGAFPFLFLWTIPLILGLSPPFPDEINYIFLMVVPLSFGFSIVKYQAMDIEIVINRSIVYALITGIIVALYLILVGLAGHFLHTMSPGPSSFLIILFTLIAAVLFSPVKHRIQNFIDKTFYRVKYNYRLAIKDFGDAITSAHDQIQLTDLILEKINAAIPVDRIALMLRSDSERIFNVDVSQGMTEDELLDLRCELAEDLGHFIDKHRVPLIKKGRAELSDIVQLPVSAALDRIGLELIIPLTLQEKLMGLVVLGKKMSETKYSEEDIELLMTMANEGFMALERFKLQETMILERAEKEKLQELSNLKSEFISHVSHELRTPLTSIQWSIENLLDGIPEQPGPKIREYLEGVHGSSQHLGRMIENLLDVSRIEAGRIEIYPEKLNVLNELNKVLDILKPFAEKKHINIKTTRAEDLWVKADRDRLRDILTNLLDNAIKFSNQGDVIEVKIDKAVDYQKAEEIGKGMVAISVVDHGPGIPKEKQESIFERFEQVKKDKAVRETGLGLGLHIVKKLVELQGGRIWVESEVNKGSKFAFVLPTI